MPRNAYARQRRSRCPPAARRPMARTASAPNRSGTVRAVTLIERDARAVAGIEKLRFFDVAAVGGRGSRLRSEDGRELLDLSASWGAASLGNASPDVAAAV